MSEDQRTAAELRTILSSAVITAALAAVAVEAGVATFVFQHRTNLDWFYFVAFLALLALVVSIWAGAYAIGSIVKKGFDEIWSYSIGRRAYNVQAASAILGLILVVISAFLGDPKKATSSANVQNRLTQIEERLIRLERADSKLRESLTSTRITIRRINARIQRLERNLAAEEAH